MRLRKRWKIWLVRWAANLAQSFKIPLVLGGIVLSGDIQKPVRAARGAVSAPASSRAVAVVGVNRIIMIGLYLKVMEKSRLANGKEDGNYCSTCRVLRV